VRARGAFLPAVLFVLMMVGCDLAPLPSDGTVVRDSAGIVIVENDPALPAWGDGGWTIEADPEVRIGSVDAEGPEQFHRVVHARFLGDGRIAVEPIGNHISITCPCPSDP